MEISLQAEIWQGQHVKTVLPNYCFVVVTGITCCLTAPGCTEDDLMKCTPPDLPETATEEQLLERSCRHIECVLELYGRCGDDVFLKPRIPDYFPEKGYKKMLNSVCVKTNPIRKKALDTATCSRNAMYHKDLFRACGIVLKNREEYCRALPAWLQCLVDSLNRECGPDAGEAYPYGNAIHYDPYDCLE